MGRVAHAYLLTGPRGTGKTTTGRLYAKALNCTNRREGEPCNQCESCQSYLSGRAIDLVELDAASNRGIDEIRAEAMANQSIKAMIDPKDIAQLAVFLASDAAKAISGQVIPIDNDRQKA